jgi:hypothetical protein
VLEEAVEEGVKELKASSARSLRPRRRAAYNDGGHSDVAKGLIH